MIKNKNYVCEALCKIFVKHSVNDSYCSMESVTCFANPHDDEAPRVKYSEESRFKS